MSLPSLQRKVKYAGRGKNSVGGGTGFESRLHLLTDGMRPSRAVRGAVGRRQTAKEQFHK